MVFKEAGILSYGRNVDEMNWKVRSKYGKIVVKGLITSLQVFRIQGWFIVVLAHCCSGSLLFWHFSITTMLNQRLLKTCDNSNH